MSAMLMLDFDKERQKGEAENEDFYQNTQIWIYENCLTQWDSVTDALKVARHVGLWLVCFDGSEYKDFALILMIADHDDQNLVHLNNFTRLVPYREHITPEVYHRNKLLATTTLQEVC